MHELLEINLFFCKKSEGVAYRGRILIEIQTLIGELPAEPTTDLKLTDVLRIEPFLRYEDNAILPPNIFEENKVLNYLNSLAKKN